eukprot:SAG25_NODE_8878_length_399_cov_0.686667_1_plen_37_part_10
MSWCSASSWPGRPLHCKRCVRARVRARVVQMLAAGRE